MNTFETQAKITLMDQVSGPMNALASKTAAMNKSAESASIAATKRIQAAHEAMYQQIAGYAAAAATAMSASMMRVSLESDRVMTKVAAISHLSKQQLENARMFTTTTGSAVQGGPVEAQRGYLEAVRGGISDPNKIEILSRIAKVYAAESGKSIHESIADITDHIMMTKEFKNSEGKTMLPNNVSDDYFEHMTEHIVGRLGLIGTNSNQNMGQIYAMMKNMGPIMTATHMPMDDVMKIVAVMGQSGIKGDELGNTLKALISNVMAPTNKARAAMATYGIDTDKYITYNRDALQMDGLRKGLEQRAGSLPEKTFAAMEGPLKAFQAGGSSFDFQKAVTDALVESGNKSFKDRRAAANTSQDILQGAVKTSDLMGILMEAFDKPGLLNLLFGKKQGGRAMSFDGTMMEQVKERYKQAGTPEKFYQRASETIEKSYSNAVDKFMGAFTGMLTNLFEPLKPIATEMMNAMSQMMYAVSRATPEIRGLAGAALLAAGAWGSLKLGMGALRLLGVVPTAAGGAIAGAEGAAAGRMLAGVTSLTLGSVVTIYAAGAVGIMAALGSPAGKKTLAEGGLSGAMDPMGFEMGIINAKPGATLDHDKFGPMGFANGFVAGSLPGMPRTDKMGPFGFGGGIAPEAVPQKDIIGEWVADHVKSFFAPLVSDVKNGTLLGNKVLEVGGTPDYAQPGDGHTFEGISDMISKFFETKGKVDKETGGVDEFGRTGKDLNTTVSGEATVINTIKIEPSENFIATVVGQVQERISMPLQAKTGRSMTDGGNGVKTSTGRASGPV